MNTIENPTQLDLTASRSYTLFSLDEFAAIMINYRYDLELSLRECAKIIGISSATLNRIERRKCTPDLDTYYKCCQWLRYPMDYFFK